MYERTNGTQSEKEKERERNGVVTQTKESCPDNTYVRVLLAKHRATGRGRLSHSASSHFHGVAVTEIKMVAGALLPPYGGLTANVSLHHIWPLRVHHESVHTHVHTYRTVYKTYVRTLRGCTCMHTAGTGSRPACRQIRKDR